MKWNLWSNKSGKKLVQGREYQINDQAWKFYDAALPEHDGDCDLERKTIRLQYSSDPHRRLVLTIHECLHAFCWQLAEESVESFAEELGEILIKEGLIICQKSKK